jgi:uncharacterized Zn-binding protein involved in type VI secretion
MSPGKFWSSVPHDKLPSVPPPSPPARPTNVLHDVSAGIGKVVGLPGKAVDLLNTGFATATNAVAQAMPCFPAASLGSLAMGAPHAHVAHPPSGPPPIPPTPLPPIGAVLLGTSVSVLINGTPAARCGDLGMNPSCCGLPPLFEVFTGSSKVFLGGGRAARQTDMTYHCKPVWGGASARGASMAARAAANAMKAAAVAGQVAQMASMAGDAVAAATASNAAISAAMAMSAGLAAAQMANDAAAMAAGAAMGKDPSVPPGTPGMITMGSPTVLIGGFPMPSWSNVAKGLFKKVKSMRAKAKAKGKRKTPRKSKGKGKGKPGGG